MIERPRLLIWGASGHASVVVEIVRLQGVYEIAGFIDDIDPRSRPHLGSRVRGGREQLEALLGAGVDRIIIAIGDCPGRLRCAAFAEKLGYSLGIAVHPSAVISASSTIGPGCVVAAGSIVNPGTRLAESVIVNSSASVDHDCVLERGVHVAPGAHLAGRVRVGEATWIGLGALVRDGVSIGARSVIGTGSAVVDDIPDDVVAFGVPARVIRSTVCPAEVAEGASRGS